MQQLLFENAIDPDQLASDEAISSDEAILSGFTRFFKPIENILYMHSTEMLCVTNVTE